MVVVRLGGFIKTVLLSLLRMGIVGGGTLALIFYLIDNNLRSELGITNIYITTFVSSFFPMLFVLTVEIYCFFGRKHKRKQKNNTVYLKETVSRKPLTR